MTVVTKIRTGDAGPNILDGAGGAYTLIGKAGDDLYIVDLMTKVVGTKVVVSLEDAIKESPGNGTDTVQLRATSINLTSPATLKLAANLDNLDASKTGDTLLNLTGNQLENVLMGNNAPNVLDGGLGIDTLIGGAGNDIYVVDNKRDVVIESSTLATEIDTVKSSVAFNLWVNENGNVLQNIENLTLTGKGNIQGFGNALKNTILGNAGDNSLYGLQGIDTLKGGKGNDVYFVDLIKEGTGDAATAVWQDIVTENANEGKYDALVLMVSGVSNNHVDLVLTTPTTVIIPENFEIINLFQYSNGTKLNVTGNTANNIIYANDKDNIIDGGLGSDGMAGGKGDDTYVVDNQRDYVSELANSELANEGTDTVQVTIATANKTYTLNANVENAILINTVAFKLTGNELNNVLTGNAAANTLSGGAGNDTLEGGAGGDLFIGGKGKDTYNLAEISASTDIVRIAKDDSPVEGFDVVNGFKLGSGVSDKLDLVSNKIAANAAIDGIDSGSIGSHSISNGLISFVDINSAPLTITTGNLGGVVAYLQANITGNKTVAFNSIENGITNTFVFQDGGVNDTLVELTGVTANSLNTTSPDAIWIV